MRIIRKSISLTNSPPLSDDDLVSRADDWTEFLIGIIPADFLGESFQIAARGNDSNYPLSAYEIKAGYRQIVQRQTTERQRIAKKEAEDFEKEYNSPLFKPCRMCYGCGFTTTSRTSEGRTYNHAVRCYSCNYWELYKQKHGLSHI